jgi:hypothetical protein
MTTRIREVGRKPGPVSRRPAWDGHHEATLAALRSFPSRIAALPDQAPVQERVLLGICEFRAATAKAPLTAYLTSRSMAKLSVVRFALNEVGAIDLASRVSAAIAALRKGSSPRRRTAILQRLEYEMMLEGPSLDALIARYARALLRNGA